MSAEDHRAAAAEERGLAHEDAHRYDPAAARVAPLPTPGTSDSAFSFPVTVYNPTERYLREADQHRAHARAHEKAAASLEGFEEGECRAFPPSSRAACPLLGPVTKIDDVAKGARVTFAPGTRVDAVLAHMRCHYAYAKTRGFDARVTCPLYMPGIELRQSSATAIDITIGKTSEVGELRSRCRQEVVFAKEAGR